MESEALQPQIDEAQKTLEVALQEACAADLDEVDTGELIRIEESLAVASTAAKQAVSLRLRRRAQRARAPVPTSEVVPVGTHRIFDDIRGKRWRAVAVHPTSTTVERAALPECYREGWLTFESDDEMRRVAPIPDKWDELTIDDLRLLCYRAGVAPKRVNALEKPRDPKPRVE